MFSILYKIIREKVRGKPVAVTGGVCPQKRNGGHFVSRRSFLTFVVITTYNHRCIYEILSPKPHTVYKNIFALYVPQKVASGRFPTPIFVHVKYVFPPTTVCQYNIEPNIVIKHPKPKNACISAHGFSNLTYNLFSLKTLKMNNILTFFFYQASSAIYHFHLPHL